ncbi:ABC transporter substrate binding protein [Pseudodesulfovibrio sp.]|uniref:hybrid sensor histidine kinase/response regulator n=1 Tax=Pseudodesulfovibrio sp. TaxID=2035812 RepID=UPI002619AAA9|nr:ABC transporter substrate binding protein [Pseudodesulfovibrio sp.]MDD3311852.1 ABC transporter substrate binding protein [Pseudodesulfovibrio sp.]
MKPFRYVLPVLFLFCLLAGPVRAERPKKDVLFMNSYHDGYQWSDSILEGARSVLDASEFKIDLQIEYMDAKKYHYEDVTGMLRRLYREKFAGKKFDAIIVSDNDAFSFASQYRDELFPGVPLVFCGVNDFEPGMMAQGNLTGVVENFDPRMTLDVALKLYPDKRHMVVVGDESTAGVTIRRQVLSVVPEYAGRLTVESWARLSLEDTLKRVEKLPPDAFLFFIPYYQTVGNRFYTSEEVMEEIYKHSSVPIYTAWGFLLGHGALGGWVISGRQHGQMAAEMALRILDGEPADAIPVVQSPTGEYGFDYNVLSRLGIDESKLPEGSRIINTPKAFYELPKELFWTIMVSFFLLVIILVFLVLTMMERRKVERKVKDQLAFQETLMDAVPQLVSWKDRQGRYLGSNRAFAEFFGLENGASAVSRTSGESLHDMEYAKWADEADMAVIGRREAFRRVRRELSDAAGRSAWLEVNKVPIRDRSGRIVGVLTTAENVTKERDLERQLLQSQKMEAIGTLAGGIAHDFNNILTSIINSTELALGDLEEESVTHKDLDRVLKAARRGGRVVNQILAFSRPSTEGFRSTDVGAVITEAMGLIEASMPSNIKVRLNVAPALSCVLADPTQLHQVAMNLCTNAFHALRDRGGVIEARVDRADLTEEDARALGVSPGEYVRMAIEDDGPGIAPEILDKIFDPFFSTKDKTEGTGLGLAVVHGIVRSHRGGLQVLPRPGGGTIFEIFLPRAENTDGDTGRVRRSGGPTGQRILFVEDDEDQLHTTPRLLKAMGYRVSAVGDPEAAALLVADDPGAFDMVITDYDMPGLSGIELAIRIALVAPNMPIILVSGREDAVVAAADLPCIRQVIIKPYDKEDLGDAIGVVLDTR